MGLGRKMILVMVAVVVTVGAVMESSHRTTTTDSSKPISETSGLLGGGDVLHSLLPSRTQRKNKKRRNHQRAQRKRHQQQSYYPHLIEGRLFGDYSLVSSQAKKIWEHIQLTYKVRLIEALLQRGFHTYVKYPLESTLDNVEVVIVDGMYAVRNKMREAQQDTEEHYEIEYPGFIVLEDFSPISEFVEHATCDTNICIVGSVFREKAWQRIYEALGFGKKYEYSSTKGSILYVPDLSKTFGNGGWSGKKSSEGEKYPLTDGNPLWAVRDVLFKEELQRAIDVLTHPKSKRCDYFDLSSDEHQCGYTFVYDHNVDVMITVNGINRMMRIGSGAVPYFGNADGNAYEPLGLFDDIVAHIKKRGIKIDMYGDIFLLALSLPPAVQV